MGYKTALIQADLAFGKPEDNLTKLERMIRYAAGQGASVVCLPESCNIGYGGEKISRMVEMSETKEGETVTRMKKLARGLHIMLIVPLLLCGKDGKCSNTAVLISDEGEISGTYDKSHLTDSERGKFAAGGEYPVFGTKYGRIGILICNDINYPEAARMIGIQNADIVFLPAAWGYFEAVPHWWEVIIRARAMENQFMLAAVNRVGAADGGIFSGETMFAGPDGIVRKKAGRLEECVLIEEISLEEIRASKTTYGSLFYGRKPDDYGSLCNNRK